MIAAPAAPLEPGALASLQRDRLHALVKEILPGNRFYAAKFSQGRLSADDIRTPADLSRLPFTTKAELLADQEAHSPYGTTLTYPVSRYNRLHQSSGTSARPRRAASISKRPA